MKTAKRATSLLEVVISSALLAAIFISVFLILDRGQRFYRLTTRINDRQRESLAFLAKLTAELQDTRVATVFVDPDPGLTTPAGIEHRDSRGLSYGFLRDPAGQAELDRNGRLKWQGYGCFLRNPAQEIHWLRKYQQDSSDPTTAQLAPLDFRPQALISRQLSGRIMAREVSGLIITERKQGAREFYEIVLECGRRGDPQGYWIQLATSIYPRN